MKGQQAHLEDGPILLCILCADPMHVPYAEQVHDAHQRVVLWPW